ncbi:MAG: restriction endonuclease subunit S [Verrucomicrobia bacterium]|nr:restriction endonuclease subunit S [Verrucomicrobiota bacterium]
MSKWQTIRLGSACEKIGSGATPRGGSEVYQATGISLIRSQNIYNDGFKRGGLAFIGDKHARELENVSVMPGDVLLNITGDSVARVCQVPEKILPARVNQHVAIIRPKKNILDARFLHYFLIHPQTQAHMLGLAGAGATRNALTKGMIESFEIKAPSFSEQRAIAAVLGSLDDKIELNRRMNETLEALAQSLFKSWFVDATQSALPKGWREVPLPEAIEVNPPRPLRKGAVAPYLDMANMPTRSARALEVVDREFGSGMRFKNGDTLVARITPCLENGKTCFVDFLNESQIAWGSTEYIVLQPKPPLPPEFAYFLARTEEFRAFMISNMTGTTGRQRVPAECLSNFKVAIPPAELADKFGQFASATFAQMKAHDEESRTLAALRDALLPKLLSGELRVPANGIA